MAPRLLQFEPSSVFSVTKKLSTTALSQQLPRRLMLQTVPSASSSDAALRRSAEVDAQHVRVSVDGPIVTLSGHLRSCHEKQEAERAARAAPSVTHVENLTVVAP